MYFPSMILIEQNVLSREIQVKPNFQSVNEE